MSKIIQLKDNGENVYPATYEGTFIPKLYDYETYICDLPQASYIRIGDFYVAFLNDFGTTIQNHINSINTMIQIRNFPANVWGGTLYLSQTGFNQCVKIQGAGTRVYYRPNINKSSGLSFFYTDQMAIFGKFE